MRLSCCTLFLSEFWIANGKKTTGRKIVYSLNYSYTTCRELNIYYKYSLSDFLFFLTSTLYDSNLNGYSARILCKRIIGMHHPFPF